MGDNSVVSHRFAGIFPILQTPFTPDGAIDDASLRREVDFCIRAGAGGLVIPAIASEFFTLSDAERDRVIAITVEQADGRVPVIAGVTSGSTPVAVEAARAARGADGILAMPPYVRRPDNAGVLDFFRALAGAVDVPIIIQNAPAPMGVPMSLDLVGRITREVPGTWYVKEEVPPCGVRLSQLLRDHGGRLEGVFSGSGGILLVDELARGACGCMPSAAFVAPQVRIYETARHGDLARARELHAKLLPLIVLRGQYGNTMAKLVLQRLGVIAHATVRDPQAVHPDGFDIREMDRLVAELGLAAPE